MNKSLLLIALVLFLGLFTTIINAEEDSIGLKSEEEDAKEWVPPPEPKFPIPETISITQFLFTMSIPQSNVEGLKLWNIFFNLFSITTECANFPRYIDSPYNLYNTVHRLYIDQLSDACTDAIIADLIEQANALYVIADETKDDTTPPTDDTPTDETTPPTNDEQQQEQQQKQQKTSEFWTLGRNIQYNEKVEPVIIPEFLSFERIESNIQLPASLCFNNQTNGLQCMEHSKQCTIKCPVGTICSRDIVCGSSDCLSKPEYVNEEGEKYRVCTSNSYTTSMIMVIVGIVVGIFGIVM